MTPQEQIDILKKQVSDLQQIVNFFVRPDRYLFQRNIEMFNGLDILTGSSVGTRFGGSTTSKIAFFDADPISKPADISAPSGGVTIDTQARTAINSLISTLSTLGLTA